MCGNSGSSLLVLSKQQMAEKLKLLTRVQIIKMQVQIFFNAKIKIGGERLWAGNVEIHSSSDEWVKHGHQSDKAYNSVILHLAEKVNREVVNERGG